jgi:hypothetical protein
MEHTNTPDIYMPLLDEKNASQVDTLLATIEDSLDALGGWDNSNAHFRYHINEKVNIIGIQLRGEQTAFWKKHFAGFVKATIPTEIYTAHLHQPPKIRQNNHVRPSYSDISRGHGHADNDSEVTSPTVASTATQQTRPSPVSKEIPQHHADPTSPPPQ